MFHRPSKIVLSLGILGICMVLVSRSAYAYIDPGQGSMIIQGVLFGVSGIVLMVKVFWKKICSFFKRKP